MKSKVFFCGWLIMLCVASCSRKDKNFISADVIEFDSFAKEVNKAAHPTGILIMGIIGLAICENMLVAGTMNPVALFSIVDLDTEKTLWEGGVRGRGPEELLSFQTCWQFVTRNGHICLWILDMDARKSVLIDITESVEKQTTVSIESWSFGIALGRMDGMWILPTGERFVKFPVTYDDLRDPIRYYPKYSYFSSDSREVRELSFFKRGSYSPSTADQMSLHNLLFLGILKLKPDNTKAIDAFHYADHLNFLDLIENRGFSMRYSKGLSVDDLATAPLSYILQNSVTVYWDVTVTDDYVLALYSGKPAAEEGDVASYTKSAIRIFDWDGNPLALVHVDKELKNIAYDQRTKRLYALDFEENIMYYELDDVI